MKAIRFAKVVKEAGQPEPYTLWQDPAKDREFQKAIREERVMTVVREPASTKADQGVASYLKKENAIFLVFPRSLKDFRESRIVGLKYDLLKQPKARGKPIKPGERRKPLKVASPGPPRAAQLPLAPSKPEKKFRVRARIIATVEKEIEVEAKSRRVARQIALKALENQPADFTGAPKHVKVMNVALLKL